MFQVLDCLLQNGCDCQETLRICSALGCQSAGQPAAIHGCMTQLILEHCHEMNRCCQSKEQKGKAVQLNCNTLFLALALSIKWAVSLTPTNHTIFDTGL